MMEIERGFAAVNGTRLYYERAGSGHPLVLVHGFTLDTRMWDDQFEPLAARYQVLRYDLRGFGKSGLPDGKAYNHADDLYALLAHLGIKRSFVVGLSKGGGVALDFACAHPEMTTALVLIDTILGGYTWSAQSNEENRLVFRLAREQGVAAGKAAWLAHPLFAPAMQQPAVADRLTAIIHDYSGWHFVNRDPEQRLEPAAIEQLARLTIPTLVVVGEYDLPDFHAIADTLEHSVPSCRKVVLSASGHMANLEAPAQLNALILDWLAQHQPS